MTTGRSPDWLLAATIAVIIALGLALFPDVGDSVWHLSLFLAWIAVLGLAFVGAVLGARWTILPLMLTWVFWFASVIPQFVSNPRVNWTSLAMGVLVAFWCWYSERRRSQLRLEGGGESGEGRTA
jgi:hypothetical protein